jgi:hypothetical protein
MPTTLYGDEFGDRERRRAQPSNGLRGPPRGRDHSEHPARGERNVVDSQGKAIRFALQVDGWQRAAAAW